MEVLKRVKKVIDELLLWGIIFLFLMMFGITNLNVIMRYFFNSPIVFSVEMGRYCFVSIIFLGAIFTTREDRHIHVDFFTGMFPEKIQKIIAQFGRFLMVVFFGITTIYTCRMAILNISVSSSAMKIPMAIPYDTLLAAARNDHADDPDETEKMQTDMNLLKRPKKKDDAN